MVFGENTGEQAVRPWLLKQDRIVISVRF